MAIHVQQGGAGGGRGRARYAAPMAEINIIPLVDVVLVLLIIFMLTAHVMEFGLDIKVPQTTVRQASSEDLALISITKDAKVYLGEHPLKLVDVNAEMKRRYPNQKAAYVRADRDATWDTVAKVIGALSEAKIEVRMVTQPKD